MSIPFIQGYLTETEGAESTGRVLCILRHAQRTVYAEDISGTRTRRAHRGLGQIVHFCCCIVHTAHFLFFLFLFRNNINIFRVY